jgi:hypothetical protein
MDSIARKNTGAPFPEARAHRVCFVIAFDKVGAGEGLCFVVAVSARQHQDSPGWGGYTVDEVAPQRRERREGNETIRRWRTRRSRAATTPDIAKVAALRLPRRRPHGQSTRRPRPHPHLSGRIAVSSEGGHDDEHPTRAVG